MTKSKFGNVDNPALSFISAPQIAEDEEVREDMSQQATAIKNEEVGDRRVVGENAQPTGDIPAKLTRRKRETLSKRVMLLLPESLYVRIYNASVEDEISLNRYVLNVLKEHADKNNL